MGTNRDREAAAACELAGGEPEIVHVNQLREGTRRLTDFQMMVLPGGFSYGDDLGAGRLWSVDVGYLLRDEMATFVASGKPVLGICNGFQALVKSSWLPGPPEEGVKATLTTNVSGHFECRWVWLRPDPRSPSVFTRGLDDLIHCPVAHGEGRFVPADADMLTQLEEKRLITVRYVEADGSLPGYPANPNGSLADIAGICNERGNVFGLMPHPEDHIWLYQHPRWTRQESGHLGLAIFENGIQYAREL
jgi:phosphoribosylformylglycinamidine synthase I